MRLISLLLMLSVTLAGCGVIESKKIDYKSAGKLSTLEVPPDLTAPTGDNRYAIPDTQGDGSATLSTYSKERIAAPAGSTTLLPTEEKARIERAGSERWLVVQATPQQVWSVLKDFWQENGFIINFESPETGIMETDWAENRAKIPQDVIRRTIGKLFDGLYSTPERDKFRTRIEVGTDGTEIYISHRGMEEVYDSNDKSRTVWQPRPSDPGLEAEMLRRLMVRFGVDKSRADAMLAHPQEIEHARLLKDAGAPVLEMDEGFDRAWRRVGLALDRVGFAVEDRDRSKGIYFVRYIDPQIDNNSKADDGFLSKLAFWRSKKPQTSPQLQIVVKEAGEKSRVNVTGTGGKPADPNTQNRILDLLYKELK
jgi:outer membrane protein assembly factor BamC